MLTNISWTTYLQTLLVLLPIYYGYVILFYYRRELIGFFSPGPKIKDSSTDADQNQPALDKISEEDLYEKVENFSSNIRELIARAYREGMEQEGMYRLLEPVFQQYNYLSDSAFRSTLDELVLSECSKYGAVIVSEEDLVRLWRM